MAESEDLVAERIQATLDYAATLPMAACLPTFLMKDGKILPGINAETGQIMTRAELDALPPLEAMGHRMIFVARCATTKLSKETLQSLLRADETA